MQNNMKRESWYLPKGGVFDVEYFRINEKRILTYERTRKEVNFIEEILNLKPGAKILDLGCGVGRHSLEFAKRGFKVTGLDVNPVLLKEAKKREKKQGVRTKIRWVCKDMRKIAFKEKFDVVLNLFTTFGYFTERENQNLIFKVSRALKEGGYFVLEVNHREYLLSHFQHKNFIEISKSRFILYERNFDFVNSRLEEDRIFISKGKKTKEVHLSIRLYTLNELIQMCEKANLFSKGCYGDYERKPVDFNTERCVLITQKNLKIKTTP